MTGMPNCPSCDADLTHDVLDFEAAPPSKQTQPGQMLVQYFGTCPDCNESLTGSAYLAIRLD